MIKKFRSQKGQSAVETALLMPLILFTTIGMIVLAIAIYGKVMVAFASRETARDLALGLVSQSQVKERAISLIQGGGLGAKDENVVTVTKVQDGKVYVKVTYSMPSVVPGMGLVTGGSPWAKEFHLTSVSVFKKER